MSVPQLEPGSTSSATDVRGSVTPRIWTPPLRDLSDPASSYGYDLIEFGQEIGWPLLPWQRWLAVHMGELLADGRPRFRMVLVLVARQNGKTLLCRVITLYWLFVELADYVLGSHVSRDYAKKSWKETIGMALAVPQLVRELPRRHTHLQVGEEDFVTTHGTHYGFGATNRRLGRGLTVHRNILDELREHKDWEAYRAAMFAMNAVRDAQAVAITNQGDARSIVLDQLRDDALTYVETGAGDRRLGIFEWSAENGAIATDPRALAAANPEYGGLIDPDALLGDAMRAERAGGEVLAGFQTEVLCQRVILLNAAIDATRWAACKALGPLEPVNLAAHRDKLALCLDVALDGSHATLVAAATLDGVTYLEVVERWQGFGCTAAVRADLPDIVRRLRPRTLGWFPNGPAAAVAASLNKATKPLPRRVVVAEIIAEVPAVCMGLAEQVTTGEVVHPDDPMLNEHVRQTQKLPRGDAWIFTRRGSKPIDGSYAAAGAVHLARTLPAPLPPLAVA